MSLSVEVFITNLARWLSGQMIGNLASEALVDTLITSLGRRPTRLEPIDRRLAQIEVARASLSAAIGAIDELKNEAEKNSSQVEALRIELDRVSRQHATAHGELSDIRELAKLDAATVKKVMGVPTAKTVWIERGVSFVVGVLASIAANFVWGLIA